MRFKKRSEKKEVLLEKIGKKRNRRTETLKLKQTKNSLDTILKTKKQISNQ